MVLTAFVWASLSEMHQPIKMHPFNPTLANLFNETERLWAIFEMTEKQEDRNAYEAVRQEYLKALFEGLDEDEGR